MATQYRHWSGNLIPLFLNPFKQCEFLPPPGCDPGSLGPV